MRPRTVAAAWLFLFGTSTIAASQVAQRSTIGGLVTDETGAVIQQAAVVLNGTGLIGGTRTAATGSNGRYGFGGLLPGTYEITVSAPGMQAARRSGIQLPVDTTYDVNFRMTVAHVTEAIEVATTTALIDLRRASMPTIFPESVLYDVPTGRTLSSVLGLAPGVTTTPPQYYDYGFRGEVAWGGTQRANTLSVDGVGLNEPNSGEQWSEVEYNWLQQVQITALGAGAEYGGFTGAIANGVLRSGANRVGGLGEWLVAGRSWTSTNFANFPKDQTHGSGLDHVLKWWTGNGQAGAPVIKDRLWVFGGLSAWNHETRNAVFDGPYTTDRTSRAITKLDASPGRRIALQGFVTSDRNDLLGQGLSASDHDPGAHADRYTRTHAWNTRATWTAGSNMVLEGWARGNTGTVDTEPHPPSTRSGPSPATVVVNWNWGGCCNIGQWSVDHRQAVTVGGALGWSRNSRVGSHDVRIGLDHEQGDVDSTSGVPSGKSLFIMDGTLQQITEWAGDHLTPSTTHLSLYAQDRWMVGSRLTLEPGVRVERFGVAWASSPDQVRTTGVAPRLGVAWDVTGRQSTVARVHYGRYYDQLYGHLIDSLQPDGYSPHVVYNVTPDGLVEAYRYSFGMKAQIHAGLRQPSVDQWLVAVDRSLGANTVLTVQYVDRRFGNFLGYVDASGVAWKQSSAFDPGPDGQPGTPDDVGNIVIYQRYWNGAAGGDTAGQDLALSNPNDAHRHYDGVQLIVTRRFANRWQAQVSYSWSTSRGTVSNDAGTNVRTADPSAPNRSRVANGKPTYDFSEFKALGSYRPGWLGGFTLGSAFRWHSGERWARGIIVFDPFFLPLQAESTGSRQGPSVGSLDARVEKSFGLARQSRAGVYVDVFNVTNVGRPTAFLGMSGPNFGHVYGWTDPRTARLGVRFEF